MGLVSKHLQGSNAHPELTSCFPRGPTLLTCGIMGVPRLHSYSHRLDDVYVHLDVYFYK